MRDAAEHPVDGGEDSDAPPAPSVRYVSVYENRTAGDEGTCLRPLGLCELGGSCDSCWYGPDHPRHRRDGEG